MFSLQLYLLVLHHYREAGLVGWKDVLSYSHIPATPLCAFLGCDCEFTLLPLWVTVSG